MPNLDDDLFVTANGLDQRVTVRGSNPANPALMILSGPGAPYSRLAAVFAPWEADFTIVQWDQPGAGETLARHGETPLTLAGLAADGIAVAQAVLRRLGQPRLALLGLSGGSVVGLQMARARPDLLSAYVGAGQFVDVARQEAAGYALLLARAAGDPAMAAELTRIGPPPYADAAGDAAKSMYAAALTPMEQAGLSGLALPPFDPATRAAAMRAYERLRDEFLAFDARHLGRAFDTPMAFIQGHLDAYSTTAEVAAYAAWITAPAKAFAVLEGAGHSPAFTGAPFLEALRKDVAPLISGRRRA